MGSLPAKKWRMCSLLCGYSFMATFWLGFKFLIYLRSFFSQKSMQSDWRLGQGPVGGTSGSPSAGCWHLPGVSDCCWIGRSPGCVSAVPGRGSGRLELTLGLVCHGLSSGVLSPGWALF